MLLFPCICLVFFGGIETFQRVAANPSNFFLIGQRDASICAAVAAGARRLIGDGGMASFMNAILLTISVFRKTLSKNLP
jgi:hypothetical protein